MATFQVGVTAPIGHALMGGGIAPASEIIDPLFAQGIVLLGADAPIVWLSIDWCEIRNDAYEAWRDALADAAGTTRDRVLLAAIHQHDTPIADFTAQRLLDEVGLDQSLCDVPFVKDCIARTAMALRASLANPSTVTHYGVGTAVVQGVASNRRIVGDDGTVTFGRNSSAPDAAIRAKPEGLIDPLMRTLSFWNADVPVAAMSTYAVHPMSYYGRGGVSSDFVGMARAKMTDALGGMRYLYFSGCSGDQVAGKYNDGSVENRAVLAESLYAGMQQAWTNTRRHPLDAVSFRKAELRLSPRSSDAFSVDAMTKTLADTGATSFNRNLAAMGLSWRKRLETNPVIDVPVVDFGAVEFILMPAESFVGYQLRAQTMRPDTVVMVAGYGESAPGYIPTAVATSDGFNESHTWLWVDTTVEDVMNRAMREALNGHQPPPLPVQNASIEIPAQEWPKAPGPRSIAVHITYPGGKLSDVNADTGIMLTLHNWGGMKDDGAAEPEYLAERYNVIAVAVDYLQSGARSDEPGVLPYDFGLYQAMDALRALHYIYSELALNEIPFARGRIFSAGGSGGGNVSQMVNKLAPRTFACIVDLSGMAKLNDDIAYGLEGASILNAGYSQDPESPAYLSADEQQIRFIGDSGHVATMKALGNQARIIVVHGTEDAVCPVEDKREMVDNMVAAGLRVEAHFIGPDDVDGVVVTNTGHGVGDRTRMVSKFADPYLLPTSDGDEAPLNDFDSKDRRVQYETQSGTYVISYETGAPNLAFIPR